MTRRGLALSLTAVLTVLLGLGILAVPVPYVAIVPGPVTDTLSEVDGKPLVDVQGVPTYPTSGRLELTTVALREHFDLLTALRYWTQSDKAVVPREVFYPPGQTQQQVEQESTEQMQQSQEDAVTAALGQLGILVATVDTIPDGSPLHPGDRVTAVDGQAVAGLAGVQARVRALPSGRSVTLDVERDGAKLTVPVTTVTQDGKTALPATLRDDKTEPVDVSINLRDVGGPSAGMMFALAIIERLTPGELTGGRTVAGTGTISGAGDVGPIGGIQEKLIGARRSGADVFLTPAGNCDEASRAVPGGLRLVKVATLQQAVDDLTALAAGREASLPHC